MNCKVFEDRHDGPLEEQVTAWLSNCGEVTILHMVQSSCAAYGCDIRDGQVIGNTLTIFYK